MINVKVTIDELKDLIEALELAEKHEKLKNKLLIELKEAERETIYFEFDKTNSKIAKCLKQEEILMSKKHELKRNGDKDGAKEISKEISKKKNEIKELLQKQKEIADNIKTLRSQIG